jgi:hypothetical protein
MFTENYEFLKPEISDVADITSYNENWDKLDDELTNRNNDLFSGKYTVNDDAELDSVINEVWESMPEHSTRFINIYITNSTIFTYPSSWQLQINKHFRNWGSISAISPNGIGMNKIFRNRISTSWQPWEWETPPLKLGVEYRTTERFCDKAVYIKRLSCDAMPGANATKHIGHGITNMGYIVDFGGSMTINGQGAISLPYYFASENQAHLSVTNENIVIVSGANDLTNYNDTQVWVKYTKTTS